jgi:formate dehydrogenase iron-sulfur subunit
MAGFGALMAKALLYDSTLCVGCRECEGACSKKWGLPYNEKIAQQENISAHKLTAVQTFGERFSRRLCMHCVEPTCVSVCPVGALQKTTLGAVIYDEPRCIGCRYCMLACPFQVPSYEWNERLPRIKKCNLCHERQVVGKVTACSEICPTNATITGEREALIAEARKRLAQKPTEYYQRIYGVREVGGTSVLYISAVPFEQIGLKTNLPQEALPALTWRALSLVPNVATLGGALLGGVYWITHRREEVAAAEGRGRSPRGGRP